MKIANAIFRKNPAIVIAAGLIVIFILHISYINNGFTWLDHGDIESGRTILPIYRLSSAFFTRFGQTGFFRPIVTVFNSIDYSIYGLWPPGFHLTNVLIHLAVVFVSSIFIRKFFSLNALETLLVMFIVGVHPLGFLPIGAISYRQELLVALFSFSALYFHIKSAQNSNLKYILLSSISFLLALFSKETSLFIVPSIILLWEITNKNKNYRLLFFEALAVLIYLLLRFSAVPEIWHTNAVDLPFPESVLTRIKNFTRFFSLLVLPFTTSISDSTKILSLSSGSLFLRPILAFFTLIVVLTQYIHKHGLKSDTIKTLLLIMITLLPAASIVPLPRFYSPHYGYLALPFFAVLLILLLRKIGPAFGLSLISAWLITASYSTFLSGFRFKNDFTLFAPEVVNDKHFLEGHQYLGDYFLKQKNYSLAENHYKLALAKDEKYIAFVDEGSVMNNLAAVYFTQNKLDESDSLLEALSKNPLWKNNQTLLYNRMVIFEKKSRQNTSNPLP